MADNPLRERVARAANPMGWSWYDRAPDDHPAKPVFAKHALASADAAISTLTLADHIAAVEAGGTHRAIPVADYRRLLDASEADDMIVRCETCGAWLDRDDPATATTDDFTGCWKMAAGRYEDSHLCRSYRALDPEPSGAK